ncbi:hypothetical protein PISS_a0678 [Pseudoalteromonas issachenkonii]|uniref:Uncharacterized protein n=1 Tax=Pseudoalteromonas issachenkonii TaxID=152297 RepID=A0ABM6N0V6_9GAMM|nr:hypothetical protein PISS_a0678 [Pseudoalteromonas issachenkonii]
MLFLLYNLNSNYVPSLLLSSFFYPPPRLLKLTLRALVDYSMPFLNQQKQKW